MSIELLLDTNIVSEALKLRPNPKIVRRLEQNWARCALAAPVWQELNFGCRMLPAGKRRTRLETYLAQVVSVTLPILPYDAAAAVWHGEERARLTKIGKIPSSSDAQIAAIAVTAGLTLVTANVRDFASFTHLTVEDWSR